MRPPRPRRAIGPAFALVLLLTCTACSFNNGYVLEVRVDGGERSIALGEPLTLSATVVRGGGATDQVVWTSSAEGVAVVAPDGVVATQAVGTTQVTATSVSDPSVRDAIVLTIGPPVAPRWIRQIGTSGRDFADDVVVVDSNVFVVGTADGAFDGGTPSGSRQAFIRSFDPEGAVRWTQRFGTSGALASAIVADADGRLYVIGDDSGNREAFVRSYDGDGGLRWSAEYVDPTFINGRGIAVDAEGNTYATGTVWSAIGDATVLDVWVRSYDRDGALRWGDVFGGSLYDGAMAVVVDGGGNVYLTGRIDGDGGSGPVGWAEAFVRSYDRDGALRWTDRFGSDVRDIGYGIAVDADGNTYVTGTTFGAIEGANAGGSDAFLRSYDRDGTHRWTRQFGTAGDDVASALTIGADGHLYVAGSTAGVLGEGSAGGLDAFVRSYDREGALRGTHQYGTDDDDAALGVALAPDGALFTVGETLGALDGSSAGGYDAFVRAHGR
jgi:hypothetical protein